MSNTIPVTVWHLKKLIEYMDVFGVHTFEDCLTQILYDYEALKKKEAKK